MEERRRGGRMRERSLVFWLILQIPAAAKEERGQNFERGTLPESSTCTAGNQLLTLS